MEENDDIDLRPYLLAIVRRWPWIVGVALLAGALAAGAMAMQPKTYTAAASVLMFIRQTGSQVGVNEPLLTIETIDSNARRQGLLALAESQAIETRIAPDVLARVAPSGYKPGMIVDRQYITVDSRGDLLTISAEAQTPQQAQDLANAWATTYVDYVKTLYTDQHSNVELVGNAVLPFEASGPRVVRNAVIAGLLGAIVAVAAIVLIQLTGATFALPQSRVRRERGANYSSTN
jgi:capsular polysaccharide biosynthesis protein